MKLKTSCCKGVTLKKDILRFAPVWTLYLIGMMLILVEMGSYQDYDRYARNNMQGFVVAFGVVNIIYAAICANLLFGDLYNTKLCYSLHAMPYRRESWLATHWVSGLLFSIVPNAVAALIMMFHLEDYWFLALYWYLAATLQFIFFYGIATVSALLTGNRFAMLVVYAVFNFVSMLAYATIEVIYLPMLSGVVAHLGAFSRFSPVVYLFNFEYFQFAKKEVLVPDSYKPGYDYTETFYQYEGLADGWGYLAILAVVGIAAAAVAVWLYRKRHLESAGDFVAFPKIKAVACVILTVVIALCFALLGEAFGSGYIIWLAVGLIVGYFVSLMLLERRIKVFRKSTLLGFVAMALVVTLSLLSIYCDWFGIESWTPEADKVQSVTITNRSPNANNNYGLEVYGDAMIAVLEDPTDIERVITAHQDILGRLGSSNIATHRVTLTYKMKSGRTVVRSYHAPATGEGYQIIRGYLYNTDNVLGFTDAAKTAANMDYMYCNKGEVPPELYEAVLRALQQDCANGYVLTNSSSEYYVEYAYVGKDGGYVYRNLAVLGAAGNYISLMKGPELAMGYADWDSFLTRIQSVTVGDYWVDEDQWEELLTAVRKDIEAGNIYLDRYTSDSPRLWYEYVDKRGNWASREFYITKEAKYTNAVLAELYTEK